MTPIRMSARQASRAGAALSRQLRDGGGDVGSSVPLQQALRHLQAAFANFFAKRAKYPTFKSRKKSRLSAEYTRSAFTYRDGRLTLAKNILAAGLAER